MRGTLIRKAGVEKGIEEKDYGNGRFREIGVADIRGVLKSRDKWMGEPARKFRGRRG